MTPESPLNTNDPLVSATYKQMTPHRTLLINDVIKININTYTLMSTFKLSN